MSASDLIIPVDEKPLQISSYQDLTILEAWDKETNKPKYVTFYHVTADGEVYFGQSSKNKREITLEEYVSTLERIRDEEIYPEVPGDASLTIAPDSFDDVSAFLKNPNLDFFESTRTNDNFAKAILDETLMMEQVSTARHPNIVAYYGCRVRRGYITAIVLERHDQTLTQHASTSAFQQLDKAKFVEALESAVDCLHSLGLAHNDIKPDNVMVKDGMPVLIDFGSCQPLGKPLRLFGTPGWYEETFSTSEAKHDTYSLGILRQWLEKPE